MWKNQLVNRSLSSKMILWMGIILCQCLKSFLLVLHKVRSIIFEQDGAPFSTDVRQSFSLKVDRKRDAPIRWAPRSPDFTPLDEVMSKATSTKLLSKIWRNSKEESTTKSNQFLNKLSLMFFSNMVIDAFHLIIIIKNMRSKANYLQRICYYFI